MHQRISGPLITLLLACCVATGTVRAEAPASTPSLPDIVAQQREIQHAIEAGAIDRPSTALAAVRRAQAVVFTVTDGRTELSQLSPDEQMALHNALQAIQAQLDSDPQVAQARDVCKRERATGSKILETRCGTAREREITREGGRGYLEKRQICRPGEPGCSAGGDLRR
jgi:hypothetical protein